MNSADIVMQSYGRCCASNGFFDTFYLHFLTCSAEVRAKFADTDMTAQKQLLRHGILNLVMHARGMPDTKLRALGCSHARGGLDIRPELYSLWLDALLKAMSEVIKQQLEHPNRAQWLASRSRAGEFTVIAAGLNGEHAEQLADELTASIEALALARESGMSPIAFIGIGAFSSGEPAKAVFARTDEALAQAQGTPGKVWARLDNSAHSSINPVDWREWIDDALKQSKLKLFFQPVTRCADSGQVLHQKVLARLIDPQGEAIAAGQFLPWIERLNWSARLDMAMLKNAIKHLSQYPQPLALSLSGQTLRDAESQAELLQVLRNNPRSDGLLTLELDERYLPSAAQLEQLSQSVRAAGYSLGLQHFGGNFGLIGDLTNLGLAYLKIDGSYIRALDQETDKRRFIEAIYRATNSIDMPLIAEMVETEGELAVLKEIGIQGAMGRLIGAPAPWAQ